VRVSVRKKSEVLALVHTLTLFLYPERDADTGIPGVRHFVAVPLSLNRPFILVLNRVSKCKKPHK
jgi:hypothetical protein